MNESEYLSNPKTCKQCGKELGYEKRMNEFCNSSCFAKHSNPRRPSRARVLVCPWCKKEFKAKRKTGLGFCSNACYQASRVSLTKFSDILSDRARRLFLVRKHGNVCSVCRNSEWNGLPIPLELDHIDGNPDNNAESNCRVICPNCHAQTPNYRGKNARKNGGEKRKKVMRKYMLRA